MDNADKHDVVVIGNFDGVHLGHAQILREAVALGKINGLRSTLLTFDPHPDSITKGHTPPLLTRLEVKRQLALSLGIDRVMVQPFDQAFSKMLPHEFVDPYLISRFALKYICVGDQFRFGEKRRGDVTALTSLGARYGFTVRPFRLESDNGFLYSSSRVRQAIEQGTMLEALSILGRPHTLFGQVVHGDKRGRTLGYPTANIDGVEEMLPSFGVYICKLHILETATNHESLSPIFVKPYVAKELDFNFDWKSEKLFGVVNIGLRPTISASEKRPHIEVHLFDFDREIYGAKVAVALLSRIRDEVSFSSMEKLRRQIAIDVKHGREMMVELTEQLMR